MEPFTATWSFARSRKADSMRRDPLVLDALHALQCWRVGHPGRTFRFVRPSPFPPAERLSVRVLHQSQDALADGELALWCHEHKVQGLAARPQSSEGVAPA